MLGDPEGGNINRNEENTDVIRVARRSEGELDVRVGVHTWYCRNMGWNILRGLTTTMMTSIGHRNLPQNTPVTSKRPLLGVVRPAPAGHASGIGG